MNSIALPKIPLSISELLNPPGPISSPRRLKTTTHLIPSLVRSSRRLASFAALSGSSGGAGGYATSGGGGGDGWGEGETKPIAVGELYELSDLASDDDVIILSVGGMSCGGCAASVKRILENQPKVSLANVNFEKAVAVIWVVPEVKAIQDWQQELGVTLANHLTSCGFKSELQEII